MKKRMLSLFLCIVLCLSLLPMSAFAGENVTEYDLWVDGMQVTSENKDNILSDTGTPTATYDPDTTTLTLNGAQITQTHEDNEDNEDVGGAIYAKQALTVKVIGESSISPVSAGDGIYTTGNLTITGDESLNITTGYENVNPVWVNGGKLTVNMNGNLTVNAAGTALSATGNVTISGSGSVEISAGADRWSGVYSSGGDVTLSGSGDVMIDAGYGIYAQTGKAELAGSGSVTITSKINGVFASGDVVFSGGGDASISGEEDAVKLKGTVLLNGTGSPISIKAGTGYKAVLNSRTGESPVGGTNLAYYNDVTGKPEEQSVVYNFSNDSEPALTGITVTTPPDKTEYTAYEDFDPTGMVVTATYEDSSTKVVSATVTDGTDLKCSKTSVTVSYTEGGITKTAEQSITVNPGVITSVQVKNFMAPTVGNTAMGARNALADVISLEYTPDIWPLGCIDLVYAKCNNPDYVNAVKGGFAEFNAYMNEGYQDSDLTYLDDNDEFEAGNVYVAQFLLEADNAVFDKTCTYSINGAPAAAMADKNFCGLYVIFDYSNPEKVTITLDPNGGSCETASVQTGSDGKLTAALPEASAAGASFEGWYTFDGNQVTADTVFYVDTTLYAHYTADKLLSVTITMQEPAAGKSLYDMHNKWFMNGDLDFTCIPTAHAQLNPNEYPVKCFKISDPDIVEKYKDTTLTDEEFFTAFVGESYPEEMDFDDVFEKGGNYLIYIVSVADLDFDPDFVCSINNKLTRIQYEFDDIAMLGMSILVEIPENDPAISYTVTWKSQDGSSTLEADAAVEYGAAPSFDGSAPSKAADASYTYIFAGWATSPNQEIGTAAASLPAVTGDVTYYAAFSKTAKGGGYIPVIYTLTFNTNGGSAISSVSGTYGKVIDLDKYVPTKSGFDFGGWYSDSALTAPVDEIKLNGNKTVYAKWIEKSAVFPFTDVKETDWSYDDIYYVWEKGLMQGTSETTFAPKIDTSRAMIVTILWRLEGEPIVNYAMSFDDVADGQWYTEAIRWAQANNIVNGYSAEKFGPTDLITREQMAAILYRYAQSKGEGFTGSWMFPLDFKDAADVSDWANEAMHWCVMKGLINGVGNDLLDPQGYAKREQVAAILHRFCENIVK